MYPQHKEKLRYRPQTLPASIHCGVINAATHGASSRSDASEKSHEHRNTLASCKETQKRLSKHGAPTCSDSSNHSGPPDMTRAPPTVQSDLWRRPFTPLTNSPLRTPDKTTDFVFRCKLLCVSRARLRQAHQQRPRPNAISGGLCVLTSLFPMESVEKSASDEIGMRFLGCAGP